VAQRMEPRENLDQNLECALVVAENVRLDATRNANDLAVGA
jgi:hypothetical protein